MISTAENIQTRVSEIEYVFLPTICNDTKLNKENLNEILQFKDQFDQVCSQIDNLDSLVNRVKVDLTKLEKQMEIAESQLNIPAKNPAINFLISMNPFLKTKTSQDTNIGSNGAYEQPDIFKTVDYITQA